MLLTTKQFNALKSVSDLFPEPQLLKDDGSGRIGFKKEFIETVEEFRSVLDSLVCKACVYDEAPDMKPWKAPAPFEVLPNPHEHTCRQPSSWEIFYDDDDRYHTTVRNVPEDIHRLAGYQRGAYKIVPQYKDTHLTSSGLSRSQMMDRSIVESSSHLPKDLQMAAMGNLVEYLCVLHHLNYDPSDLVLTLRKLLKSVCDVALDPAVSKPASDLLEKGASLQGSANKVAPELLKIVDRYQKMLIKEGAVSMEQPESQGSLDHLLWMLDQILINETQTRTKKHRWIGFVQSQLIDRQITTVEVEREFTRPILNVL